MRRHAILTAIAASAALAGCAGPQYASVQGGSQEQLMKDRAECRQQSQQKAEEAYVRRYGKPVSGQVVPDCKVFDACLAARGYQFNPMGSLVVPAPETRNCVTYGPPA